MTNSTDKFPIFTIGHSNHSSDKFVGLLKDHEISAVVDVRSSPYSQFCPHFNQDPLRKFLNEKDIHYVFMGEELGARRSEKTCYIDGKVQYDKIAEQPLFHRGIERMKEGAKRMKIAMMCSEKDPLTCHRTILIARVIKGEFSPINHILEDGSLENHNDAESRLLKEHKLENADLFMSNEQRLMKVYADRERIIAYQEDAV
jgi:uncharacterized protein (DUF488 family)